MLGVLIGMGVVSIGGAVTEKIMIAKDKGNPEMVNTVVKTTLITTLGLVIIKSVVEVAKLF